MCVIIISNAIRNENTIKVDHFSLKMLHIRNLIVSNKLKF
jgi:hypothetical protein